MSRRVVPIIIAAVALVVVGWVLLSPDGEDDGVVAHVVEPEVPERVDVERHEEGDPLAVGDLEAPVTIVVFSDFQCPYCALWNDETLPELQGYVDEGDLRIEWRDVAVFGEDSQRAAMAAYAAGMQGKYVEFASSLFDGGEAPSPSALKEDNLLALAKDLDLDIDRFTADLDSDEVRDGVERNFDEAHDLGVFSTPMFLINGHPMRGAQDPQEFIDLVESPPHA